MYEVRVRQEIPYWNGDDDDEIMETTGKVEEYVAGTFKAEHMARIFKDALEMKIAEEQNFVSTAFTPDVTIWEVTKERKQIVPEIKKQIKNHLEER